MTMPRKLRATAFATFAVFVALSTGEAAVRVLSAYTLIYDLEMSRYSRSLKQDAGDAAIAFVHVPSKTARLMGVEVAINAAGLRDQDYSLTRDAGIRRHIFLGDSITLGWGVDKAQTFEEVIERELNRRTPAQILNFGHGNYNTEQETALFLKRGLAYKPDEVDLFYFINDAEPTQYNRVSRLSASALVTFIWSRAGLLFPRTLFGFDSYVDYYQGLYGTQSAGWARAKAALAKLKQACDGASVRLKVVIIPDLHQLKNYPFAREHRLVADYLRSLGIPHQDLTAAFAGTERPRELWVAPDDAHPNAEGHRRIAEAALPFIAGEP